MIVDIFQSKLIVDIFKVSWLFTLLKSADFLHSKKSADNKKFFEYGRDWFLCQDFGFCQDFVSMHKDKNLDP